MNAYQTLVPLRTLCVPLKSMVLMPVSAMILDEIKRE